MNDKAAGGAHWSFWVISAVALIWNAMGIINLIVQMNPDALASYPASHRAIIDGRPLWATGGFALAVFGGALGCLLLLLRKAAAVYAFVASLLGVIAAMTHTLGIVGLMTSLSYFELVMMILMPLVMAAFLIWYAKWAERKGWVS